MSFSDCVASVLVLYLYKMLLIFNCLPPYTAVVVVEELVNLGFIETVVPCTL